MKYNLRFFLRQHGSRKHADTKCFAETKSEHLPSKGDLVFPGDSIIKEGFEEGTIYRVLYVLPVYDDYLATVNHDGCTSVEVVLRKTSL